MRKLNKALHCVIGVIGFVLFLFTASAVGQQPGPELLQQMHDLARKAQSCGMNATCLNDIQQEMQKLNKALQGVYGTPKTPSQDEIARQQTQQDAVKESLADKQDDPCYAVYQQKETAKRVHGSDLPWLSCVPLEIQVRWEVRERNTLQGYDAQFTTEESYPGYLSTLRDQHNRKRVLQYQLIGPAPRGRVKGQARIVDAAGTFTGVKYKGIFASEAFAKKPFAAGKSDFAIEDDGSSIEYIYSMSHGEPSAVLEQELRLVGREVSARVKGPQADLGFAFEDPSITQYEAASISPREIADGMRSGRLEKIFPVAYQADVIGLSQTGQVTLTILFDRQPGRLAVTPADPFQAMGPNEKGDFQPQEKVYSLKNGGQTKLHWAVSGQKPWLSVSAASGTLAPGAVASVMVRPNDKARKLKEGVHKSTLAFTNKTNGRGNTHREVILDVGKEEKWRIHISGYETSKGSVAVFQSGSWVRAYYGVRFNYKIWIDFTIRRQKGKWKYKKGNYSVADVGQGSLYDSVLWTHKSIKCVRNCNKIRALKGSGITGTIVPAKSVRLNVKDIRPEAEVEAILKLKCRPMPACMTWESATFTSDTFMDRIDDIVFPLINGHSDKRKVVSPGKKDHWVNYSYSVRRLHPK